jgi:hypothetical protein
MADSNLVAVVGVGAGALIALLGPVITARATNQGQKRKFSHEERLEDRRELRELLDRAVEEIAEVEEAVSQLHVAYLEHGDSASACASALADARGALRKLDLVAARLSIRRGDEADITARYREVGAHGEIVLGRISRYLTLPAHAEAPSSTAIGTEISEIEAARGRFVAAAKELVGSRIFEDEAS